MAKRWLIDMHPGQITLLSNLPEISVKGPCSFQQSLLQHVKCYVLLWMWINKTGPTAFQHFDPLLHASLWQTVLYILGSQQPTDFIPRDIITKTQNACCLSLVQITDGGIHAKFTRTDYKRTSRRMSLSDLEL